MKPLYVRFTAVFAFSMAACQVQAAPPQAQDVQQILEKNCGACHKDSDDGGFNYIHSIPRLIEGKKLVPGDPRKSRILVRMKDASDPMPPEGEQPRPTDDEIQLVEDYISSLATDIDPTKMAAAAQKESPEPDRRPVSMVEVIHSIHGHLQGIDARDRPFQRYFVLNHLHNLPNRKKNSTRGLDQADLNLVRAATSKTVNSLTWQPAIVVPKIIDSEKTVMAIDIRDLGWEENRRLGRPNLWNVLLQDYPYGLTYEQYPDVASSQQKAAEIYEWTGIQFPWIRADWFVATALQPHFYHALLYDAVLPDVREREPQDIVHADGVERIEQPMSFDDLLRELKVDLSGDIHRERVARAGFTRSGVSSQPRLLERAWATYGYLWNSYDFKRGNQSMNLHARPLGPEGAFPRQFQNQAFQHDGGEAIFGLPNGLHGYLLMDGKGDRIPFGPPDVVEDRAKTLGNGIIVNGLSCIACHKQGLIEDFEDEIRFGIQGLPSAARQVVRKIYLDRPDLNDLIRQDQQRYRQAAIAAIGPFLSPQLAQEMAAGGALVEPIAPVAKRFLVDTLDLTILASELEVDPARFSAAIEFSGQLQRIGLAGIREGGTTNREIWQNGSGLTNFQKAAHEMKLGTPGSVQPPPWRGR